MVCKNCNKLLKSDSFYQREDRVGLYAWCKSCMSEQGRAVDWPPESWRGYGLTNPVIE